MLKFFRTIASLLRPVGDEIWVDNKNAAPFICAVGTAYEWINFETQPQYKSIWRTYGTRFTMVVHFSTHVLSLTGQKPCISNLNRFLNL